MVISVTNLITDAMALSGAVAIDESPTSSELAVGLRVLNMMIDSWASQRTLLRSTTPITFPLVANTPSYTIGPVGAAITAQKPTNIRNAYIVDSQNISTPLDIIGLFQYNSFEDKAVAEGMPICLTYDPGAAQQTNSVGTIYIYYNPDQAYTLNLECDTYLTEFSAAGDTVTFEGAYYEALLYNLAVRLFRFYRDVSVAVPAEIQRIARESYDNLRSMNSTQMLAAMELPGKVSNYNIYTDGVR